MLSRLPHDVQQRLIEKVEHYLAQPDPLAFAKRIVGSPTLSYRFQVGEYRVVFDWHRDAMLMTKVGHRRDIYRD